MRKLKMPAARSDAMHAYTPTSRLAGTQISMAFLLLSLAGTAVVVRASGFVFRRRYGFVLIGVYAVYSATNLAQMRYGIFGP